MNATPSKSNNPIPSNPKAILAKLEDAADGCHSLQDEIGLAQIREDKLRAVLLTLKGDPTATPPVNGLMYLYDQARLTTNQAKAGLKNKDAEAKTFLTDARDVLKKVLGTAPSQEWVLAGYTEPGSTAVPNTQDERFASLNALAQYLAAHPDCQVPAGTPLPEITATRAQALHTQISDCRQFVNDAETAQGVAKASRDAAVALGRKYLIALVDELTLLLSSDDPRWEAFGFNIPANPRAPEPATNLELSAAGPGRVHAKWRPGTRSGDDRILIQIDGTDPDYRVFGKSGGDGEQLIDGQPTGALLRVKIIALNRSLEATDGPVAEITVP